MANPFDQFDEANPFDQFDEGNRQEVLGIGRKSDQSEQGFFAKTKDLISGEGRRREGIPEITTAKAPLKAAFGMLTSTSPEQQRGVIAESFPGASFEQDEYGNIIANIPDQGQFYLNKPGLSAQDMLTLGGQGVAFLAAAKGGAAPFRSPLTKAAGVGLASGGASVGLDLAAQLAGSEQGVDIPRAGVSAASGALFETFAPVFSAGWRFLNRGGKKPTVAEARGMLQNLGFSPDDLTDEAVEKFISEARRAASPEAAATFAEAQSLPVPVPLKRGQVSGRAQDQMFEDLAEKGAYGETAETLMRGTTERTDEALRGNVPMIQQQLGRGVSRVTEPGQGMAQVQGRLVGEAEALRNQIGTAYDVAETTVASISPEGIAPLVTSLQKNVGRILRNAPAVRGEIDDLGTLAGANKPITLNEIFDWRRGMSELAGNAPNATERKAAGGALRAFDDTIEDIVAGFLGDGDGQAASAWFDAISKRREFGKLFEGREGANKLVASLVKKGEDGMTVDPQVASKLLFGNKGGKLVNDPQTVPILGKLKGRLGAGSDEWLALKEEAFVTLMQNAEGSYQGGQRQFSGIGFKKALDTMKSRNPRAYRTLFGEGERRLINQFANVAARATNPVKGGANFSNTSVGMSRLVQSLSDALFMGSKGRALLSRIFPAGYEGVQMGKAAQAARGRLPLKELPAGTIGGSAAAIVNERTQ